MVEGNRKTLGQTPMIDYLLSYGIFAVVTVVLLKLIKDSINP